MKQTVLIDSLDSRASWITAYCTLTIGPPLTEGSGSFHVSVTSPIPAGHIYITKYATLPDISLRRYLLFDIQESSPKTWWVRLKDSLGGSQEFSAVPDEGHLLLDLSTAVIDLSSINNFSFGARAPIEAGYFAIIDNMRAEDTLPPPLPPMLPMISVSPTSAAVIIGETKPFTASIVAGSPPYTITWIDNISGLVLGSGLTFAFLGEQVGDYELLASVTDINNNVATSDIVSIRVTEAPPLPPTEEPTPPNTSHISVIGNNVYTIRNSKRYLHVGPWDPWGIDTSSLWHPAPGEGWMDPNITVWNPENVRNVLRDIRDVYHANKVYCFFWMDWMLQNKNVTLYPRYPTTEIGNRDAYHAYCDIAESLGLDVELRMWGWDGVKSRNPLYNHTSTEFINAWVTIAQEFSRHPNVVFNLFDEPTSPLDEWLDLAYNTLMQIRVAGVGHVIYIHYRWCGGEGIDWIRQFGNHYQLAFSRHEYIESSPGTLGTTEAHHKQTIEIHNEGYPVTVTASGVVYDKLEQIAQYRRWYTELLKNNIGIGIYCYGRPNIMAYTINQYTPQGWPYPPNNTGIMFSEVASTVVSPPPTPSSLNPLLPMGVGIFLSLGSLFIA